VIHKIYLNELNSTETGIEKDPWQPWSYQGWLKTVIKTGKIVKTVTLPSGFIVQERIF